MPLNKQALSALRMRLWTHNGLQGFIAMDISHMQAVQRLDSTTTDAKELAAKIEEDLNRLAVLCKERIDP